jgi:hypothetical protein
MKLIFWSLASSLVACGTALAQDHPVNSPAYHAVHNAQSPYYTGPKQQDLPPPQPTGYWEKTWGAIAADGARGILGAAVGAGSEDAARQRALAECRSKGGGCKVELAYRNQCAVLVTGDKLYNAVSSSSIERATELSMKECQSKDSNCRVYYSACTEPIFHKY